MDRYQKEGKMDSREEELQRLKAEEDDVEQQIAQIDDELAGIEEATQADEATLDTACESSREGAGWENGDPLEWRVDALHKFGKVGVILFDDADDATDGIVIRNTDTEAEGIAVSMSPETATRFARDILAMTAHVEDIQEAQSQDVYDRLAAIAEGRGWYVRWDREGGVLGFREDGTAQPGQWVPCDKDHPDALPDVARVERELPDAA